MRRTCERSIPSASAPVARLNGAMEAAVVTERRPRAAAAIDARLHLNR
jgi:hypothetical protein